MQTQNSPRRGPPDTGYTQALSTLYGDHHSTASAGGNRLDRLLGQLDKVKRTGPGRWIACCPAHDDRNPSLSIRETDDGVVLVKCWSGCGGADVIAAAGLQWADLFPERTEHRKPLRPGERWLTRDVLKATAHEILLVIFIAQMVRRGDVPNDDAMDRLFTAYQRLSNAAREVGCNV